MEKAWALEGMEGEVVKEGVFQTWKWSDTWRADPDWIEEGKEGFRNSEVSERTWASNLNEHCQ
jgi:hypothetical protein